MYPLLCSCQLLVFQNLELHRTFFLWIESEMDYIFLIGRVMSKPVQSKKSQRPKLTNESFVPEMISLVRIHTTTSYIWRSYIFRQQLPVKFIFLLRAACLFPKEGERKLVHSRFFLPLEPWTNSKTVQCVQYLIRMYLPCLAVNQILL